MIVVVVLSVGPARGVFFERAGKRSAQALRLLLTCQNCILHPPGKLTNTCHSNSCALSVPGTQAVSDLSYDYDRSPPLPAHCLFLLIIACPAPGIDLNPQFQR